MKGLVSSGVLATNVGDKGLGENVPVALGVVGNGWLSGGDVVGQRPLFPPTATTPQPYKERPVSLMPFNINGSVAAIKGDVVGLEAGLQTAVVEEGRNGLGCLLAFDFGKRGI